MDRREEDASTLYRNKSYEFRLYPGRSIAGLLMVFDEHGRELYDDALPGVAWANGVGIDKDDNLYVVAEATRRLDGEPYFNPATNTLIKLKPKRARLISSSKKGAVPVPLADEARPKRPADLFGGSGTRLGHEVWAEGAEWFYGGVGYNGRHGKNPDFGCDCWPSGFALDYFARSFAPEIGHHSVAVLDSNGNLILRVGRYGNVDDGVPLISEKGVRSISIGGDEVGLFYAPFLATHTDRRLFIADIGNFRVLSVRLGYHAGAKVPLRDTGSQDR